jgi:hypothetical protein
MPRFTIRDVLLVMVIVGLAAGWCIDRRRQARELKSANAEIGNLRRSNEAIMAGPDWALYDKLLGEVWNRSEEIRKRERELGTIEGQRPD